MARSGRGAARSVAGRARPRSEPTPRARRNSLAKAYLPSNATLCETHTIIILLTVLLLQIHGFDISESDNKLTKKKITMRYKI